MYDEYREAPSPWRMVLASIPGLLLVYYLIVALNTGDVFWFWPGFDAQPAQIVVHCYGQDVVVDPASEAFTRITALVNRQLSGRKRWDSLSMSQETYEAYLTSPEMMVLELRYAEPVRIHANFKFFKHVDTFLIPLVGRHDYTYPIFGRYRESTVAGSLHVETTQPLREYIAAAGLCVKP